MKKSSASCRKGFVSTYFLSVLLYFTTLLSILTVNDQRRLKTVMNMKENDAYFIQEAAVVADIRCRLLNERLTEGAFSANGYAYDLDLQENRIYAEIHSDHPETLDIVCDLKEKELLDLNCVRPFQN